jgi:hypothetical protein
MNNIDELPKGKQTIDSTRLVELSNDIIENMSITDKIYNRARDMDLSEAIVEILQELEDKGKL